ncbi:MAG: nuclear transport factor 2 family protein, partial [Balneolaceae bacterium]
IENTKRQKSDPDFDASKNKWEYQFTSVDVTGNSAAVKLELYNEGKHVYTDYLSLLRFDDEWKIVAKVYHQH